MSAHVKWSLGHFLKAAYQPWTLTLPLYLVVHHQQDPEQRWPNDWLDVDRLAAIQTTKQVARLCSDALVKSATVFVHRCGFGAHDPIICCSLTIASVDQVTASVWLVKFSDQIQRSEKPFIQPRRGQNFYHV